MAKARDLGFTLVEVLIVVVLMSVLAAVVIPQFSSSTDDAKRSTSDFNLSTMRTLIASYQAQHNGLHPVYDLSAKSLTGLLTKTKADGTVDAAGPFGPYILSFPENAYTGATDVKAITNDPPKSSDVTAGNAGGWLYNASAGKIWLDSNPGYTY
jgi:general secretion pathway protein G